MKSSEKAGESAWKKGTGALLDLLFPPACEICHEVQQQGKYLCEHCNKNLPRITEPCCEKCGEMFEGNIQSSFVCPNCAGLDYAFSFARPVLDCSDAARELIHHFKYSRAIHLARDLASIAAEAFDDPRFQRALEQRWPLVPVPLHWRRRQHRFFNQSEEIARHLGKMLDLPVVPALKRIRATETQTHLSRKKRLQNLRGAMQLSRQGKALLRKNPPEGAVLIDDVFTTGATVHECAKILHANRFENVVVVTVMRG
jgi:ComF family protein